MNFNIKAGKKYKRRNGDIVTCVQIDESMDIAYFDTGSCLYKSSAGSYLEEIKTITEHDIIEEVNEMNIEVGKWYKTTGGHKVFVAYLDSNRLFGICDDNCLDDPLALVWDINGKRWGVIESKFHIVEEWKEPKTGFYYLNVYGDWAAGYKTRKEADTAASNCSKDNRLACVRIEWKEGQFDD